MRSITKVPSVSAGRRRVKYPLAVKLIGIMSIVVILAMAITTAISSWFFSQDSRARAEENTLTVTQVLATQLEARLDSTLSGALTLMDEIRENAGNAARETSGVQNGFDRNASVALVYVPGQKKVH